MSRRKGTKGTFYAAELRHAAELEAALLRELEQGQEEEYERLYQEAEELGCCGHYLPTGECCAQPVPGGRG